MKIETAQYGSMILLAHVVELGKAEESRTTQTCVHLVLVPRASSAFLLRPFVSPALAIRFHFSIAAWRGTSRKCRLRSQKNMNVMVRVAEKFQPSPLHGC
jgi:hypothetical protein